jgi:predicted RNA-binding Zn ribbon-like protein
METSTGDAPAAGSPRELPIVGGHLALDFANTIDDPLGPARHDHLASYADLLHWSSRVDSVGHDQGRALHASAAVSPQGAATVMATAHRLRSAINELFGHIADEPTSKRLPMAAWTELQGLASDALRQATPRLVSWETGYVWSWDAEVALQVPLHPVAMAAANLLVDPRLRKVKRCARCPWLFLDTSKNGSRRWCDMNDCGRAQKIERYVARRAAQRTAGRSGTAQRHPRTDEGSA